MLYPAETPHISALSSSTPSPILSLRQLPLLGHCRASPPPHHVAALPIFAPASHFVRVAHINTRQSTRPAVGMVYEQCSCTSTPHRTRTHHPFRLPPARLCPPCSWLPCFSAIGGASPPFVRLASAIPSRLLTLLPPSSIPPRRLTDFCLSHAHGSPFRPPVSIASIPPRFSATGNLQLRGIRDQFDC